MIEINVRIKIDTNDPREAYLQAMSTLSFSGHTFEVSDYWLANGKPIPKSVAQSIKDPLNFFEQCGRAVENDPGLHLLLEDLRGLPPEEIPTPEVTQCVTIPRLNVLPNAGGARGLDEEIENFFGCIRNSSEPFRQLDFDIGEPDDLSEPDVILGSREIDLDIPMDATDIEIAELLAQTIPGNRISKYFKIMSELPVFEERSMHTKIGTYFDVTHWKWVANAVIPYRVSH